MKCLIVDDDAFFQAIHSKMLSAKFDCDIASNGDEAIQRFEKNLDEGQSYDLICMDIEMPVCNGHEALAQIRAIEKERGLSKQVKVVMLSTLDDPKTILDSYLKGVTSYIVKPVTEAKLMQILKNFNIFG